MKRLINGMPGCPRLYFGVVDVRDVADMHVRAMTHPAAEGERFIAVSGEAFLLNPSWIKGSEPLLSALGAAFFAVAAAAALASLDRERWALGLTGGLVALAALAVTSLNHRYAALTPVSTKGEFAALTVVAATVAAVAIVLGGSRERSAGL